MLTQIILTENLNIEFDDESPEEDYFDPEEKKKLLHFSIEYPYTEKALIQLIEIFRKHRVSIGNLL